MILRHWKMTAPFIEIKFQNGNKNKPLTSFDIQNTKIIKWESRVQKFLELLREGPTFVCIICNRWFYGKPFQVFHSNKYILDVTELADPGVTSKGTTYVCKTYHLSLKKQKIPAQPVSNKMKIFPHSVVLKNLNVL